MSWVAKSKIKNSSLYIFTSPPLRLTEDAQAARRFDTQVETQTFIDSDSHTRTYFAPLDIGSPT